MEPQSIIRCELKSAWMNQNELVQSYKELTLRVVVDLDQFLFGLRSGTHLGPGGRKRHERQQQAHCKHTNAHRQPLSFLVSRDLPSPGIQRPGSGQENVSVEQAILPNRSHVRVGAPRNLRLSCD